MDLSTEVIDCDSSRDTDYGLRYIHTVQYNSFVNNSIFRLNIAMWFNSIFTHAHFIE